MWLHTIISSILLQLLLTTSFVSAQGGGNPLPGAFVVQLSGSCSGSCRGALQSALASSPETSGCTIVSTGIPIGALDFESIKCPENGDTDAAAISAAFASQPDVQAGPAVQRVEADIEVTTAATATTLWGVDEADGGVTRDANGAAVRDSLRTCSMSSNNGAGVTVWILDTGCEPTGNGLCEGFFGGSRRRRCRDRNGHGTHVGGTATDGTYGVAPGATRACVKVLDNSGSGSLSTVLGGISFATENRGRTPNGDVINMSLGASFSQALNDAVEASADTGVYFSLAAGNSAANACGASPASAPGATVFTVAAHDIALQSAVFTNFGTASSNCVELSAPGVAIVSNGVNGGTATFSGTSMAAPHVAGACALLMSDGVVPTVATLTAGGETISRAGALDQPGLGVTC
eukprot:TRINITY_DN11618_c0_g1_i1.p1 TRINITY_DN11618_c0_g1~~TRINITY_DN11618_c0_g1_i1.p1  ORF type:complete len:405 (-),score=73.02 TRINITY_DN11618_c0_g1_i1:305-1519(-)